MEMGNKGRSLPTTDISLRFRTKVTGGVILAAKNRHDHLLIELHNNVLFSFGTIAIRISITMLCN